MLHVLACVCDSRLLRSNLVSFGSNYCHHICCTAISLGWCITLLPLDDAEVTLVNEGNVVSEKKDAVQVIDTAENQWGISLLESLYGGPIVNVICFFLSSFTRNAAEPTAEGELFVSSLKSMLTTHLENFGQVNDGILGLWAGPEHWRKKAKRRRLDEFGSKCLLFLLLQYLSPTFYFVVFHLMRVLDVAAQVENEENVTNVGKSGRSKCAKKTKKTSMDYAAVLLDTGENRSKYVFPSGVRVPWYGTVIWRYCLVPLSLQRNKILVVSLNELFFYKFMQHDYLSGRSCLSKISALHTAWVS